MGGLYHPSGPKSDPHTCSDMWLTGAPLYNPKPGTYNTVGLDQIIALHTKQYTRRPSVVLSIDAGTGICRAPERFLTASTDGRFRRRAIRASFSTGCSVAIMLRPMKNTPAWNAV